MVEGSSWRARETSIFRLFNNFIRGAVMANQRSKKPPFVFVSHINWGKPEIATTGGGYLFGNEEPAYEVVSYPDAKEHWGSKYTCAKCRKAGTMAQFQNQLTILGIITVLLGVIFVLCLLGLMALMLS